MSQESALGNEVQFVSSNSIGSVICGKNVAQGGKNDVVRVPQSHRIGLYFDLAGDITNSNEIAQKLIVGVRRDTQIRRQREQIRIQWIDEFINNVAVEIGIRNRGSQNGRGQWRLGSIRAKHAVKQSSVRVAANSDQQIAFAVKLHSVDPMIKTRDWQTRNDFSNHRMVGATQGQHIVFVFFGGAKQIALRYVKCWCLARRNLLKRVKCDSQSKARIGKVGNCIDHLSVGDVVVVIKSKRRNPSTLVTNIQSSVRAKGSRSRIVNAIGQCPNIEFYRHQIVVKHGHA